MSIDPDQTSHYGVSDLGLHFLHMSHIEYTGLHSSNWLHIVEVNILLL